jgi:hypothetical protein
MNPFIHYRCVNASNQSLVNPWHVTYGYIQKGLIVYMENREPYPIHHNQGHFIVFLYKIAHVPAHTTELRTIKIFFHLLVFL